MESQDLEEAWCAHRRACYVSMVTNTENNNDQLMWHVGVDSTYMLIMRRDR